jgi:hypothetical protein
MQRLALLVSLMLVRQRHPLPYAAGSAEVGAEAMALPSGLLALIGEAVIAKPDGHLEARSARFGPARAARLSALWCTMCAVRSRCARAQASRVRRGSKEAKTAELHAHTVAQLQALWACAS